MRAQVADWPMLDAHQRQRLHADWRRALAPETAAHTYTDIDDFARHFAAVMAESG